MKEKEKSKTPEVGDEIYIPTSIYLSHGVDDVSGGKAKINKLVNKAGCKLRVIVEEDPGTEYDWEDLESQQFKLWDKFRDQRAQKSPDVSPESNCWASPGDIVNGEKIDYYIP